MVLDTPLIVCVIPSSPHPPPPHPSLCLMNAALSSSVMSFGSSGVVGGGGECFAVLFSVARRVPGSMTGWSCKHGEAQTRSSGIRCFNKQFNHPRTHSELFSTEQKSCAVAPICKCPAHKCSRGAEVKGQTNNLVRGVRPDGEWFSPERRCWDLRDSNTCSSRKGLMVRGRVLTALLKMGPSQIGGQRGGKGGLLTAAVPRKSGWEQWQH